MLELLNAGVDALQTVQSGQELAEERKHFVVVRVTLFVRLHDAHVVDYSVLFGEVTFGYFRLISRIIEVEL